MKLRTLNVLSHSLKQRVVVKWDGIDIKNFILHLQLIALCGYILLFMKCTESLTKECCKYLMRFRIVPPILYQQNEFQEDEGVLEMHAWLNGEDFPVSDTNRTQYQVRPVNPHDINPHREYSLASLHYQLSRQISYLYTTLKRDKSSSSIKKMYYEEMDEMISYITSFVAINRRD